MLLPVDFSYPVFAFLLVVNGVGTGLFSSPNSSAIMGSVPARLRGVASGMRATFQNSGTALSIGAFFSLMIAGLASTLPHTLYAGLARNGVRPDFAHHIANLPPVSSLFASVLGLNPIDHLLGQAGALKSVSAAHLHVLTGRRFFPSLISGPFHHGLVVVFVAATALSGVGAVASLLRGGRMPATATPELAGAPATGRSPL
jgi:hypothetical protein